MKSTKMPASRGQALIVITFAIVGLVGMTGLAVDGGNAFSDRRHAQNAADTSVIAAALARLDAMAAELSGGEIDAATDLAALNRAASNGYDNNLVSNHVEVYMCDEEAASCPIPYAGDPEYVQVIITSHVNTWFARVIGVPQVHNRVQAIARADDDDSGPAYGGDSIVSLAEECKEPGNFVVEGTADIILEGGGMFVNTEDPDCGFQCNTSAGSITGDISTAGGELDMNPNCTDNLDGTASADGDPWAFPVYLEDVGLEVPPECDGPLGTYTNWDDGYPAEPGLESTPTTVLTPGLYSNFPPKKEQPLGDLYDTIFMLPGTYCMDTAVKLSSQQMSLIGHDITWFIKAPGYFSLSLGIIEIDAPDSGDYAGWLMIVEPDYTTGPQNCKIDGSSYNYFEGAIFAPWCNITINGGSNPEGYNSQIIGYTVKLTGSSTITFTYDSDKNPVIPDPPELGLMQ